MDAASISFVLFTIFSSLRIISYVPQIRRVAIDTNGASAISYSTWGLWTGANIATALYAAMNLKEFYLSAVSSVYAICCIVVILLTILKRRRLSPLTIEGRQPHAANSDRIRSPAEALELVVCETATALAQNRRAHYAFEQTLAVHARQVVWNDVKAAVASAIRSPRGGRNEHEDFKSGTVMPSVIVEAEPNASVKSTSGRV